MSKPNVEILRFVSGPFTRGNALAFADVRISLDGKQFFEYPDVKLFLDGRGRHISPKQEKTQYGWAYTYLIPEEFQDAIRRAMIQRYENERTGQLALGVR